MKKGHFITLLNASALGLITGLSIKYVNIHIDKPLSAGNPNFQGVSIAQVLPPQLPGTASPSFPVSSIEDEKRSETEIVVALPAEIPEPPTSETESVFNDLRGGDLLIAQPNKVPEPEIEEVKSEAPKELTEQEKRRESLAKRMAERRASPEWSPPKWSLPSNHITDARLLPKVEVVSTKIDYEFDKMSTLSMAQRMYAVMSTHVDAPIQPTFNYAQDAALSTLAIEENIKAQKEAERKREEAAELLRQKEKAEAEERLRAEQEAAQKAELERERAKIKAERAKLAKERQRLDQMKAALTQASKAKKENPLKGIENQIVNALSDILLTYNLDSKPKSLTEQEFKEVVAIAIDSVNNEFKKVHGHAMFKDEYELYERNESENMMLIYFSPETSAKPEVVASLKTSIRLINEGLSQAPARKTVIRFLPSKS